MNKQNYNTVHPNFKWNGISLDRKKLLLVAYDLIKEGGDFDRITGEFLLEWFNKKSFITVTTSGTTGVPKKINLEKQAMIYSALATAEFFNLKAGNRVLNCLSTNYIAGKMMLIRSMILGFEMDFVTPISNPLKGNRHHYDFVAMVPMQVQNSILELSKVKKLIVGGVKISETLRNQLLELPTQIFETYGMTETITHIAVKKIGEKSFSVLPNVKIATDERSCLVLIAPRISDINIVTNDVVELISETQFLLLGRIDNVINSGGVKLFPEQIEAKLSDKIKQRFFVIGIADEKLGEQVLIVIEGKSAIIDDLVFENLSLYERPKTIRFVQKFLETESGKVKRKETLL
ncbi:MAG: O-succinylbenzoic acid--CoA ligase [Flavobacteriaceae bacterium]|nr:O-succinylbenzoic acid--CoA ligase [Flavobacteriaceae bacterium]